MYIRAWWFFVLMKKYMMAFLRKKIGDFKKYESWKDLVNRKFLLKTLVVIFSIFVVILIGKYAILYAKK